MQGIGTGVVIVDTGIILTNLHVVNGADQVTLRGMTAQDLDGELAREGVDVASTAQSTCTDTTSATEDAIRKMTGATAARLSRPGPLAMAK